MPESRDDQEERARAEFPQRLAAAFQRAKRLQTNGEPDRTWLSGQIGLSVQAIGQALKGKTVFSAFTNARAARALGVNAHWLATGEESIEPRRTLHLVAPESSAHIGGFVGQLVDLYTQLDQDKRDRLLTLANNLANEGNTAPSVQDPFPGRLPSDRRHADAGQRPLHIDEMRRVTDRTTRWVPAEDNKTGEK